MKLHSLGLAAILALTASSSASATLLTFEDTGVGRFSGIPSGYGGLTWTYFSLQNGSQFSIQPNGYTNGTVSGVYTAFPTAAFQSNTSNASFSSTTAFNLDSAYLTAAWNNGLNVELQGSLGGVQKYDVNYTVNSTGPTFENISFNNIDTVTFISSGGTHNPSFPSNGTGPQFVLDNVTISALSAPEPSSWILGLAACGALMMFARLRRA